MNAANPGSTRAVPAARPNTERVHDALGSLFRARGLIAGASLLAGVARVSTRDAELRTQSAHLADAALTACVDATQALDAPSPQLELAGQGVSSAQGHVTAAGAILDATEARNACLQALELYAIATETLERAATAVTLAGVREAA